MQSNALAALEALDARVAEEVLAEGCITGDRVNGLVDGVSGKWCVLGPCVVLLCLFRWLLPACAVQCSVHDGRGLQC